MRGWNRLLRPLRWGALSVFIVLTISFAATDYDKMQRLAAEQYGPKAADTVLAWRKLIEESKALSDEEKLAKVNTFFNRRIIYGTDMDIYKQEDYWAAPLEFMGRATGDCEDYAISKYITLLILGIKNEHLRVSYVRFKTGNTAPIAHMVLGYYADPAEEPVILDNMVSSIRPASMRKDLTPVFSFNSEGLWTPGATSSAADPTARLSRWREVLDRIRQEGTM